MDTTSSPCRRVPTRRRDRCSRPGARWRSIRRRHRRDDLGTSPVDPGRTTARRRSREPARPVGRVRRDASGSTSTWSSPTIDRSARSSLRRRRRDGHGASVGRIATGTAVAYRRRHDPARPVPHAPGHERHGLLRRPPGVAAPASTCCAPAATRPTPPSPPARCSPSRPSTCAGWAATCSHWCTTPTANRRRASTPADGPGSGADAAALRAEGTRRPCRTDDDIRAVTVPGCVDGWLALHERLGRLPLADVLAPAIALRGRRLPGQPAARVHGPARSPTSTAPRLHRRRGRGRHGDPPARRGPHPRRHRRRRPGGLLRGRVRRRPAPPRRRAVHRGRPGDRRRPTGSHPLGIDVWGHRRLDGAARRARATSPSPPPGSPRPSASAAGLDLDRTRPRGPTCWSRRPGSPATTARRAPRRCRRRARS